MVPPRSFGLNEQTEDNTFSRSGSDSAEAITERAMREFSEAVAALEKAGVTVLQLEPRNDTPDAVFPNNWFSCHPGGTLVLYPMRAANRRLERQPEKLAEVLGKHGFNLQRTLDLTQNEQSGKYLEGTGSLVLDHQTRTAYASLSQRTNEELARRVAEELGYELVVFESTVGGMPVYHTNVVMSVGARYIVICLETVTNGLDELRRALAGSGKEVIEITQKQLESFCGNIIELESTDGAPLIFMSGSAFRAFGHQLNRFEALGYQIVQADIRTIETVGGGSARCMVAEVPAG